MFFVVDVETSGLTPWSGKLLSVGIQAVDEQERSLVGEVFYERIEYNGPNPHKVDARFRNNTEQFWAEQHGTEAYEEAFIRPGRINRIELMDKIDTYVNSIEPDKNKRFIAANPVAFDKMWLESMYGWRYDQRWPFHYRCLCLRSFRYGLEAALDFGSRKGAQEPLIPHHAMYDAISEAQDLVYLLSMKVGTLHETRMDGDGGM